MDENYMEVGRVQRPTSLLFTTRPLSVIYDSYIQARRTHTHINTRMQYTPTHTCKHKLNRVTYIQITSKEKY